MKRLKKVEINLIPDMKKYLEEPIATSDDVAILYSQLAAEFDDDKIGFLALNAKGQTINIMVGTTKAVDDHMGEYIAGLMLSNASAFICITKNSSDAEIQSHKQEIMERLYKNSEIISMPFLDYIEFHDSGIESYRKKDDIIFNSTPFTNFVYPGEERVYLKNLPPGSVRVEMSIDKYKNIEAEALTKEAVIHAAAEELSLRDREEFCVISINNKGTPMNINRVSIGDLSSSHASPREVFKAPLLCEAESVILLHNHPSGDTTPSKADLATTDRLINVANILGITVEDHIIIGSLSKEMYSLRDNHQLGIETTITQPKFTIKNRNGEQNNLAMINQQKRKERERRMEK